MAFQDFDLISQRRQVYRQQKIRNRIIIGTVISLILLIGSIVGLFLYYKNLESHDDAPEDATSTDQTEPTDQDSPPPVNDDKTTSDSDSNSGANSDSNSDFDSISSPPPPTTITTMQKKVQDVCTGTDYNKVCQDRLLKALGKTDSPRPKDILKAIVSIPSEEITAVIKKVSDLKYGTGIKKAALEDCQDLLQDAVGELNATISNIKGIDMDKAEKEIPEMNNGLSAVLSYQQTCIDGFPDGQERIAMEKALKEAKELSSNALAIISNMSNLSNPEESSRRLLGLKDRLLSWMEHDEETRVLKAIHKKSTPNVTVAKDGSGNFKTISAALKAMPRTYKGRYVIYIKEGTYEENVVVSKEIVNVTMYGDGSQKTVVTASKSYADGLTTLRTATFAVLGDGFFARSMGFRNSAGLEKHQAVALRVQSDHSIFLNCQIEGSQNALYAQAHRQFYRSCHITGTVDIIFGDSAAFFQNCMIYVTKPFRHQNNTVAAHARFDKRENTGIVIQNSHILADNKLEPEKNNFKTYLGRPLKEYSRTVIMETQIGDLIQPMGWLEPEGDFGVKTVYCAEFNNKGAGAKVTGRVNWPGFKNIGSHEALDFTVGPFLQGDSWLRNSSAPVRFGLYDV